MGWILESRYDIRAQFSFKLIAQSSFVLLILNQDYAWQTDIAEKAEWNKCMTIRTKNSRMDLHLEALVPKQIQMWLEGINFIKM